MTPKEHHKIEKFIEFLNDLEDEEDRRIAAEMIDKQFSFWAGKL